MDIDPHDITLSEKHLSFYQETFLNAPDNDKTPMKVLKCTNHNTNTDIIEGQEYLGHNSAPKSYTSINIMDLPAMVSSITATHQYPPYITTKKSCPESITIASLP